MTTQLQKKIEHSIELLKKAEKIAIAYDKEDGFYLAFSGGKDSQALYHIAQMAGVKFKAHFSPTSVDPPQVIRFIRKQYPDVVFEKLRKNIYDVAVEKQILPSMRIRWCCEEFKEHAGAGKVTLIGIRKAESTRRAKRNEVEMSSRKFSGNMEQFEEWRKDKVKPSVANPDAIDSESVTGCIKGKDSLLVSPIIYWTEKDVWEFLNDVVKVPHCELYDKGYHRIGCILCPMSSHKQKIREAKDFPYAKEKWIDAIIRIRRGGVLQTTSMQNVKDPLPYMLVNPNNFNPIGGAMRLQGSSTKFGHTYIKLPDENWGGAEFGKRYSKEQFYQASHWGNMGFTKPKTCIPKTMDAIQLQLDESTEQHGVF